MVLRKSDEGDKPKGGRFQKGNQFYKKRKGIAKAMDDTGYEISVEGGIVAPAPQSLERELLSTEGDQSIMEEDINITPEILKQSDESSTIQKIVEKEPLTQMDAIDFFNGDNKLSIRFSKTNNRLFKIQIFLNDKMEVRPVTYTGSRTGETFWELLKGSLKQ